MTHARVVVDAIDRLAAQQGGAVNVKALVESSQFASMSGRRSFLATAKRLRLEYDLVCLQMEELGRSSVLSQATASVAVHRRSEGPWRVRWRGRGGLHSNEHLLWEDVLPRLPMLPPAAQKHLRDCEMRVNELNTLATGLYQLVNFFSNHLDSSRRVPMEGRRGVRARLSGRPKVDVASMV